MKNFKYLLLLLPIFLSACAATGSQFEGVTSASAPNVGVVYFYRPKAYTGSAVKIQIQDNETDIFALQNGQFTRYEATPGKHEFRTDTMAIDKGVEIDIEPGENYFVRTGLRQGMWVGTWYLTRVFEDEAVAELKVCCKSGE